jgi:alpha-aminoadipic semialdehyde synthase
MIDTLHLLGRRLALEGLENPFSAVEMAYAYGGLDAAQGPLEQVGKQIEAGALPSALTPMVFGFAGYGNVSQGAQQVFDFLPSTEVTPEALLAGELPPAGLVKVVFKEEHMVEPVGDAPFELQRYYDHPEEFRGSFARFLPHLHVLMNGIYWEDRYPRLVTNADAQVLWSGDAPPRLRIIGDVSCDIDGSIQFTKKVTMPDDPSYVYDPVADEIVMGVEGNGPIVMAVDNLPAELSKESSVHFSESLHGFVPAITRASRDVPFEQYDVPGPIRRAVIAYNGELTPDFQYLKQAL